MMKRKSENQEIGNHVTRRGFAQTTLGIAAGSIAAPSVLTAAKTDLPMIVGEGDYRYQVHHQWAQLPSRFGWKTTHNVAVDSENRLYVIHEGNAGKEELQEPTIFVFNENGEFIQAFGTELDGGGHGIEIREENGEEFIYACGYLAVKTFAKYTLDGKIVWLKNAPMQSGVYADGEDANRKNDWGRDRFTPTNFAFLDDGDFFLADGYGSYYVHRYDADGNWKSCFGGAGEGNGKFDLPHGIWIDKRDNRGPEIIICDRAHNTVQRLDLNGQHLETLEGYGLPANADTFEDLMVIPELFARVSLLNGSNQVVAYLGDDIARIKEDQADGGFNIRKDESRWQNGKFIHPHDACFDADGNIFVAEWVATGRVSKLVRV